MSSMTSYDPMVDVAPFRFTGIETWSIVRLPDGLSTPGVGGLHATVVLGRQKGVDLCK